MLQHIDILEQIVTTIAAILSILWAIRAFFSDAPLWMRVGLGVSAGVVTVVWTAFITGHVVAALSFAPIVIVTLVLLLLIGHHKERARPKA